MIRHRAHRTEPEAAAKAERFGNILRALALVAILAGLTWWVLS
jgi:hypothetical protein